MFDLDPGKLLIIGIVALVVIPPKDLPRFLRQVGLTVGKLRRMAGEFQSHLTNAINEAGLDDIGNDIRKTTETISSGTPYNPLREAQKALTEAFEAKPGGGAASPRAIAAIPPTAPISSAPSSNIYPPDMAPPKIPISASPVNETQHPELAAVHPFRQTAFTTPTATTFPGAAPQPENAAHHDLLPERSDPLKQNETSERPVVDIPQRRFQIVEEETVKSGGRA